MTKRNAQELENDIDNELLTETQHFTVTHLQAPPTLVLDKARKRFKRVVDVLNTPAGRLDQAADIATHLTVLSSDVFCCQPSLRSENQYIIFRTPRIDLLHHPRSNVQVKPDIVATLIGEPTGWHHVEALVKVVRTQSQLDLFPHELMRLLEARPDFPGVYSLIFDAMDDTAPAANSVARRAKRRKLAGPTTGPTQTRVRRYSLVWVDASGMVRSPWMAVHTTDDLLPLVSFMYSMYCPPSQHTLRDPSVTWRELSVGAKPVWDVKCNGHLYKGCDILHCAEAKDRRTVIFKFEDRDDLWVIKDAYWDTGRKQKEPLVLKAIHARGKIPGVVSLRTSTSFEHVRTAAGRRIMTPSAKDLGPDTPMRERLRMVLASTGKPLVYAKSVKELLMGAYDALETHRAVVLGADVLHRDMSVNNILVRLRHGKAFNQKPRKDTPRFISTVLNPDGCNYPRSLVIDFDNAASLRERDQRFPAEMNLSGYAGTPGFAARSVCAETPLSTNNFVPMPQLHGRPKELYIQTYSQEVYDSYCDTNLTCHGVPRKARKAEDDLEFCHEPAHDVESIFWSLAYVLMKAPALDQSETSLNDHARFTWRRLRGQGMPNIPRVGTPVVDSRDILLAYSEADWANALAPGLASVAPLLSKLAAQVQPEYALLEESPRKDHLHEAMRRLLLEHIVSMSDPLTFPEKLRPIPFGAPKIDAVHDDCGYWPPHLLHLKPKRNIIKLPGRAKR